MQDSVISQIRFFDFHAKCTGRQGKIFKNDRVATGVFLKMSGSGTDDFETWRGVV
jgi:hypothetical protein